MFLAGTSRPAELTLARPSSPLGCSCRRTGAPCGGALSLGLLLTKVVTNQSLVTPRRGLHKLECMLEAVRTD